MNNGLFPIGIRYITMIFEYSSNIISGNEVITLRDNSPAELLFFHNEITLLLSQTGMAMFKNRESVLDPLGNGLLAEISLGAPHGLISHEGRFVKSYQAGFVELVDGRGLLITPNDVQLFPDSRSALTNTGEIARLHFGQ